MKLGVCTNMIASENDRFGLSHIQTIAGAGFDYIELSMAEMMSAGREAFMSLAGEISASPIPCTVASSFLRPEVKAVGDGYDEKTFVQYVREAASRAAMMGVESVVFGSPRSRSMEGPPYSLEDTLRQLAHSAGILADIMNGEGIAVLMEPLNRMETNVINTFEECAGFCKMAGRKELRAMIDFAHFRINGEPYSSIIMNSGILAHVHISRPFGRKFPMDEREEDYGGFIRTLREVGYNGNISIEAVSEDVGREAAVSNKLLRKLI